MLSAVFAVDAALHPVGVAFLAGFGMPPVAGELADLGLVGRAQAFVALIAGRAVAFGPGELVKRRPLIVQFAPF